MHSRSRFGGAPSHPSETLRGNWWDRLPEELRRLIAEHVCHGMVASPRPGLFKFARRINKLFAATLRPLIPLFRSHLRADFAPAFVEWVMRYANDVVRGRLHASTDTYSYLYGRAFAACTEHQRHPKRVHATEAFYGSMTPLVHALLNDGTLRGLTAEEQVQFAKYLEHVFKFLDRFYAPRLALTELRPMVQQAFAWENAHSA